MDPEEQYSEETQEETGISDSLPAEEPDAEAAAARAKELKRRTVKYGLFGAVFLAVTVISGISGDYKTAAFGAVMTLLCGYTVWRVTKKK